MTDGVDLAIILAMALATYACRLSGYWLMGFVELTPRIRRGLNALPGAVVASLVVPGAIAAGVVGVAACAVAVLTMWLTRRDIAAMLAGCASAAALRALGLG
jgi:uncharacterized membrane protein